MTDLSTRALATTPRGCQTLSKNAYPFPLTHVARGSGSRLTLADGRELIDWVASLATVTLGHAHPVVNDAIRRQLHDGGTFALPHRLEVSVSERLCAVMGYEQARWSSTGSEATEAAVRVARIATGRDVVLTEGYHSWFSTFTAARIEHPGCPEMFRHAIREWTEIHQLKSWIGFFTPAAVILEPMHFTAEQLREIIALAHSRGALVIFDEVVSGLRVAMRGAQELYDVRPDLSVYGKAITNGTFPVACVVGSRALMQHAWPASGTYSGHPIGLAAVNAVLDVYEREPIIARMHEAGRALIEGVNALGGAVKATGHPARPIFTGAPSVLARFHAAMAAGGVLTHPAGCNAMAAHTKDDVAATVEACARAMREL